MATNTNRTKGHNAERYYKNLFIDMGFKHCVTSRYGSRLHDDAKIDLLYLPFNVQIKAGKQSGMKAEVELRKIFNATKEAFPASSSENNQPNILVHKKEVGRGKKRDEFDEIVSMSFKDFTNLINKIIWE